MISTTIFIISLIVGWRLKSEKFFCAHCRRKRWIIDSEVSCAAEMTRFTRCMFCVVAERDERTRGQLQAALLKEMWCLRCLSTFEAKIEERTPARSGEASHSQAEKAATEDLHKELSSLRKHVHREFDGMQSKVARSTPQPPKRQRLWLLLRELPGMRQILLVMPRRSAPRVEMRRRSSRMPGCEWLKRPLAPTFDFSTRFLKPHPGRSSLPKQTRKRDAEGDGERGP